MKKYILLIALAFSAFSMVSAEASQKDSAGLSSVTITSNGFSKTVTRSDFASDGVCVMFVPSQAADISIQATADGAKVEGLGATSVAFGTNRIPLTVVSADGKTTAYELHLFRGHN